MRLYISPYYRDPVVVLEALFWIVTQVRVSPPSIGIVGTWVKCKDFELSVILTLEYKWVLGSTGASEILSALGLLLVFFPAKRTHSFH